MLPFRLPPLVAAVLTLALVSMLSLVQAQDAQPQWPAVTAEERHAHIKRVAPRMLTWIADRTEYSVDHVEPRVMLLPAYAIRERIGSRQALAYFEAGTVFLRDDFRPGHDDAMLLHELVHLVQWENGRFDEWGSCRLELEAYELQIDWAKSSSGHIPGAMWMASLRMCAAEGGY